MWHIQTETEETYFIPSVQPTTKAESCSMADLLLTTCLTLVPKSLSQNWGFTVLYAVQAEGQPLSRKNNKATIKVLKYCPCLSSVNNSEKHCWLDRETPSVCYSPPPSPQPPTYFSTSPPHPPPKKKKIQKFVVTGGQILEQLLLLHRQRLYRPLLDKQKGNSSARERYQNNN